MHNRNMSAGSSLLSSEGPCGACWGNVSGDPRVSAEGAPKSEVRRCMYANHAWNESKQRYARPLCASHCFTRSKMHASTCTPPLMRCSEGQHERAQELTTACLPFAFKIASSTWCAVCMKRLHLGSSASPFSEVPASPPSFESFASSCCATLPRNPMTLSVAAAPTASSSGGGVAPPEAMFLPTTPAET